MNKKLFDEICVCAISLLNLFNIITTTDTRLKIVSLFIAIICLIYYFNDFLVTRSKKGTII